MHAETVLETSAAWFARASQPDGRFAEICAQALAMRRAAIAHYREFAERLSDLGYDEIAMLFARLGETEAVDASVIGQFCALEGLALENSAPQAHSWLATAPLDAETRALLFWTLTAHDAIAIALEAERNSLAFMRRAAAASDDLCANGWVARMLEQKTANVELLAATLARVPHPVVDWETLYDLPPGSTDTPAPPGCALASQR